MFNGIYCVNPLKIVLMDMLIVQSILGIVN